MKTTAAANDSGEILVIRKPAHWTSFDVVRKIRSITRIKKVGHAGTLDPFAEGVLLICVGPATKQVDRLMDLHKEYVAEILLGKQTDTLDPEGKVVQEAPIPKLNEAMLKAVLQSFVGEIEQEIPAYSAAKFQGTRLYKLARKGKAVPRLFKTVRIYELELLDWGKDFLKIRILCSRGTYVRTLARDIANKLGTVGYLRALVRTRIGPYRLEEALSIQEVEAQHKRTDAGGS